MTMQLTFDLDVSANVFEMNIRLLGGLLSAHLLAEDAKLGLMPGGYGGGLLDLALDLGERLLPAFTASPSGVRGACAQLAQLQTVQGLRCVPAEEHD